MKIAFFEATQLEKKYLKLNLKGQTLEFFEDKLTEENMNLAKGYDVISVFIYSKVTKKVLHALPKVKMIATRSTGFDHIDVKECKKLKKCVCTVPSYGENTVAEHAFALLMSISRNIHKSHLRTFKNDYSNEGLTGFDLKGKTIGIVGGGHIGMHVANIARGFQMNILVYDINHNDFMSELIGFEYAELEDLLKRSDIITLHTPYNEHTHHLLNMENIKKVKKGAVFINTARGGIIDTEALLYALEKKIISNAGLDVLEGEDILLQRGEHDVRDGNILKVLERIQKILRMETVIFTPHNAFNSEEAMYRILDKTIENITSSEHNACVVCAKDKKKKK
jgi:D-lactate dehydrogenase